MSATSMPEPCCATHATDSSACDSGCEAASAAIQTTLVDLVLMASEWSDDQTEIADLVDVLVTSGDVQLVPKLVPSSGRSSGPS